MRLRETGKRAGAILFAFAMLCATTINAKAEELQFDDVPADHWATEHIAALAEGGLVQGYGNGRFGPEDTLNIDQITLLMKGEDE